MKYKQIIFDVDDTLIDFAATEDYALHALFSAHRWKLTNDLQRQFHAYNQGLWRKLEKDELSYDELSEHVFKDFLAQHYGIEVDGMKTTQEYRHYFHEAHKLLPGARDCLLFAKKQGYRLAIMSNGEEYGQRHRLALAGVLDLFDLVVTSEEAGASKPDREIFDYFFSRSEIGPGETIFFGDGLQSDILGAINYDLDCIWFNHRQRKNSLGLSPQFIVENYDQLIRLIQRDFTA